MRKLLIALLLAAPVAHADVNPCPYLTPNNAFVIYHGTSGNCLVASPEPCMPGELIQFGVGTFGYDFSCYVHAFQWDFGDGSAVSQTKDSTHVYLVPGVYQVKLTIATEHQLLTLTQNVFVAPIGDAVPPLERLELSGVPRGYRFIIGSAFGKGEWLWDFGDGTTVRGVEREQTHVYKTGGKYLVTLTSTQAPNSYAMEVNVPLDRRRSARH